MLVVGDVPQEPAAFQARAGLMEVLGRETGQRVSVVFAVTGIRGVGKTQVAAAYARRRIADGWRLVAWVDAGDTAQVLAGLAQVAIAAGVGPAGEDAQVLAAGVRHWLEADGARRLVVFDNAADLDGLRPFVPASGAAQVVITSNRQAAAGLGTGVPVEVFTGEEALAFLAERTGLDDSAGARELANELGFLPLGLAQAAALIAREYLGYSRYLERLRAVTIAQYLARVEGDAYRYRVAEAIVLSLRAVEDADSSGRCAEVMSLVSVLAETGMSRRLLHAAARDVPVSRRLLHAAARNVPGVGPAGAAAIDAMAGRLVDASLVGFSLDDSLVAHRLVMRVVREQLIADGKLPAAAARAVRVLGGLADGISEAWRDPAGVRELAVQVNALTGHLNDSPDILGAKVAASLRQLRLRSVYLLNTLGDSTGQAILAAEPLVADCEQSLGADHPDTLTARSNLGHAYQAAGRTAEAIPLYEQTLADRERVLGADLPVTLLSRNNLAGAYKAAGRTAEAIPLLEQTVADFGRVLGTHHASTLTSRNNLADAYQAAGRTAEAIPLYEQTLADRERVLGTDHPDTLGSRNSLAGAYQEAGRTAEAIPLLEQTLADYQRVLGTDHPDTLGSRNNLALAYQEAGRTAEAIPLLEQTLADCERVLGTDHPSTLTCRNNLAGAYKAAGRTAEAIPLLEQTLADHERVLGTDHPQTSSVRDKLATLLTPNAAEHEDG
jgi:tetratricopeptide (TPR) repeat protein